MRPVVSGPNWRQSSESGRIRSGHRVGKRKLSIVSKFMLLLIVCAGALVAVVFFPNWAAERRAREFCNEIPIGSDISAATARADERKILWGSYRFYTFY